MMLNAVATGRTKFRMKVSLGVGGGIFRDWSGATGGWFKSRTATVAADHGEKSAAEYRVLQKTG
jgi:hypothetical protein